jgi:hypothetical protein
MFKFVLKFCDRLNTTNGVLKMQSCQKFSLKVVEFRLYEVEYETAGTAFRFILVGSSATLAELEKA